MWHYQVMKFKDHVVLVEYYPDVEGTPAWSEPLLMGEDLDDLLHQLDMMMHDISEYGIIPNPQS